MTNSQMKKKPGRRRFLANLGVASGVLGVSGIDAASNSVPPSARQADAVWDPTLIDVRLDSRSISFENPTGARGGGGKARGGRKGRPVHFVEPGEKVVMADIKGSGTIRHIWMVNPGHGFGPEVARALRFEVFYDGLAEPSISTPVLDFFGLPHGRAAEYYSAMISVNEGRGLNSHIPMPFGQSIRVEFTNESRRHIGLCYQINYTLEPSTAANPSYLHATFRRQNPTTPRQDFVIAEGLKGPGRFLGCAVGIRVLDKQRWYGEGEVKIYRDGDRDFPTYCGTGLEDYVGSGNGLGRHDGHYAGAPIMIPAPAPDAEPDFMTGRDFVSFYRWHIPDPIMFSEDLRVTIQQIGVAFFKRGEEALFEAFKKNHPAAGHGWFESDRDFPGMQPWGIYERSDDYCATAFVYCRHPQPVARFKTDMAIRDIGWLPIEAQSKAAMSEDNQERWFIQIKQKWGL